jgi:hypothetical protein
VFVQFVLMIISKLALVLMIFLSNIKLDLVPINYVPASLSVRHAEAQLVAGSISDGVIGIFH